VYLPDGRMFVGVELQSAQQTATPEQLEPLEFELQRYLSMCMLVHIKHCLKNGKT
jgi:hypothetical protein